MTNHDAALDVILDQVVSAGLVQRYTDADGKPAMRPTPAGERVARQLTMLGEGGQDELMESLLEAQDTGR